jgi:predicted RNA-binding Zn-ribbon protein involved in translation (DUF1610 family)
MAAVAEVVSLACVTCGASVVLADDLARVTCTHCGSEQQVPPELRARATQYRARIRAAWADELESCYHSQLAERAAVTVGPVLSWMVISLLLIPAWLVVGIFLSPRLPQWANVALVAASLAAFARFMHTYVALVAPPDVRMLAVTSLGACTSCGAPISIAEGEILLRCRFCGMTATPTRETKDALLRGADARLQMELTRRDAAFEIVVRQGSDAEAVFGASGRGHSIVGWLGSTLVVGALALTGAIVGALALLLDAPRHTDTGWILPTLVVGALLGVFWAIASYRRVFAAQRAFAAVLGRPVRTIQEAQRHRS